MAKTNVYDMTGKVVGEIELNDAVFGIEPNTDVMHEAVKNYLANQRQGTQTAPARVRPAHPSGSTAASRWAPSPATTATT